MVNKMATTIIFQDVSYTEASIKDLYPTQLVDLWNEIIDENPSFGEYIARFSDRSTGQKRVWNLLQRTIEIGAEGDAIAVVVVSYPTEEQLDSDQDLVDFVQVEVKKVSAKKVVNYKGGVSDQIVALGPVGFSGKSKIISNILSTVVDHSTITRGELAKKVFKYFTPERSENYSEKFVQDYISFAIRTGFLKIV